MRRAGVLVVSMLLAVLTGCEPGGGDTAAPTTSAEPNLEAHTSVLELIRAADEAATRRGTVSFRLDDGTRPQRGGTPQPNGAAAQPNGTQVQPQRNGVQAPPRQRNGAQAKRGANTPKKPLPLAAGRLAYGKQSVDVLVRTLRRVQNFEFRAIDGSVFAQPTGALLPIANGMPWLRLHDSPASPLSQLLDPALVDAPSTVDPTRTFDLLVAAGTIASSERATLGGAEVTRYDVDLDVERLAEHIRLSSGDQPRPAIVGALRTLAEQGTTTAPVTVFLDRHNLPRRIKLPNLAALPNRGPDATDLPMLIVNYRDWGTPPGVAVPPAGTVATVPG